MKAGEGLDGREKRAEMVRMIIKFLHNNGCTVAEAKSVLSATESHITKAALEKPLEDTSADIGEQFARLYL